MMINRDIRDSVNSHANRKLSPMFREVDHIIWSESVSGTWEWLIQNKLKDEVFDVIENICQSLERHLLRSQLFRDA